MQRLLLASDSGGICDRVTAVLFACKIARSVNRGVYFRWTVDRHCCAPFGALFQSKLAYLDVGHSDMQGAFQSVRDSSFQSVLKKIVEYDEHEHIKIEAKYRGHNFADFDTVLLPSETVQTLVNDFVEKYWEDNIIGVHIRRTDKIRWGAPGTHRYAHEIRKILDVTKDARLFVASDDPEPMRQLAREFGKRVMTYPVRSLRRASFEGTVDALIVLLLLRRTLGIIGSSCSGYSLCAAWGRPFTDVAPPYTVNYLTDDGQWVFQPVKEIIADGRRAGLPSLSE